MNQKTKYVGLLAILPLFMVAIAPDLIGVADATKSPHAELSGITQKGDVAYDVAFKVFAGSEQLPAGTLLVTSDLESKEAQFRSVSAGSVTSTEQIRIAADDPQSIRATIMTNDNVALNEATGIKSKNNDGSYVELVGITQEGDNTYDLVFKVFAGEQPLSQSKLHVTSDTSERNVLFGTIDANSLTSVNVRISADDLRTISGETVSFEPEVDFAGIKRVDGKIRG